uniref:(northern house mosquito) hypothetical protein n=1 Tax=Culex pipiens TaxID=7175 RepID=A0A8D8NYL4_CULPI
MRYFSITLLGTVCSTFLLLSSFRPISFGNVVFLFVVNPFKNENELLSVSDVSAIFSVVLLVEQLDLQLFLVCSSNSFIPSLSVFFKQLRNVCRFKLKKIRKIYTLRTTSFGGLSKFWFKDSYSLGSTTVLVGWFMRLKFGWFYSLI